jgi:hypothetical protein
MEEKEEKEKEEEEDEKEGKGHPPPAVRSRLIQAPPPFHQEKTSRQGGDSRMIVASSVIINH